MFNFVKFDAFQLKLIALITMTIDHIGYFIFPDIIFLRIIGRISFVIFAYFIANGYIYTKDKLKHGKELLLFAVIIELIIKLSGYSAPGNIFITLMLGYFLIYAYEYKKILIMLVILIFPYFYVIDYGYYGVLLIFFSYLFFKKRILLIFINLILIYLSIMLFDLSNIQFYSTIGMILICFYNNKKGYSLKYLFYLYYPIHIIVLLVISQYFIN